MQGVSLEHQLGSRRFSLLLLELLALSHGLYALGLTWLGETYRLSWL